MPGPEAQKRVLVVDDEPQNIAVLAAVLGAHYKVLAATDGKKALAIAAADPPPHLVLLDIMMPGIDGYETARRLKAEPRTRSIPVVFVTARDAIEARLEGYEHGGADYITKPIDPAFVLKVVRGLLGRE